MVKGQGGHSIAVYKPNAKGTRDKAKALIKQNHVNFIAPASYLPGNRIDLFIRAIIDRVASGVSMNRLDK